jgi:hypothetical protein
MRTTHESRNEMDFGTTLFETVSFRVRLKQSGSSNYKSLTLILIRNPACNKEVISFVLQYAEKEAIGHVTWPLFCAEQEQALTVLLDIVKTMNLCVEDNTRKDDKPLLVDGFFYT